jgi:hypothetical protein
MERTKKSHDLAREPIILIAGDHMAGIRDVHDLRVRYEATQMGNTSVAHDVAQSSADE